MDLHSVLFWAAALHAVTLLPVHPFMLSHQTLLCTTTAMHSRSCKTIYSLDNHGYSCHGQVDEILYKRSTAQHPSFFCLVNESLKLSFPCCCLISSLLLLVAISNKQNKISPLDSSAWDPQLAPHTCLPLPGPTG